MLPRWAMGTVGGILRFFLAAARMLYTLQDGGGCSDEGGIVGGERDDGVTSGNSCVVYHRVSIIIGHLP